MSEALDHAAEWLAFAERDLIAAAILGPQVVEAAGFHVQQALEKALKALIVLRGGTPPKIHDLATLHDAVKEGLEWPATRSWLREITAWNTQSRYPLADEIWPTPTPETVSAALGRIEALIQEMRSAYSITSPAS